MVCSPAARSDRLHLESHFSQSPQLQSGAKDGIRQTDNRRRRRSTSLPPRRRQTFGGPHLGSPRCSPSGCSNRPFSGRPPTPPPNARRSFNCPGCNGVTDADDPEPRLVQTRAGEAEGQEPHEFCRRCRRAFFPQSTLPLVEGKGVPAGVTAPDLAVRCHTCSRQRWRAERSPRDGRVTGGGSTWCAGSGGCGCGRIGVSSVGVSGQHRHRMAA